MSFIFIYFLRIFFYAFLCVFVCIRLVTPTNANMSIYGYDRLDRTGAKTGAQQRPDQCVNREAIGQIFREGIYFGVSVELS